MVLETAEFFADESDEAYWSFVEAWAGGTEPRPRDGATKDEDPDAFFARCASRVRDVAKKVAGPDSGLGILELSLGIRRYSPRLEMFRAVAQEHAASVEKREPSEADERTNRKDEKDPACCVARAGDAVASDLATLTRMLVNLESDPENNPSGVYSIPRASRSDHAYPAPAPAPAPDESLGGEGSRKGGGTGDRGPNEGDDARASAATAPPPPTVTLYASLGSDCFASFHGALRDAAERGAVRYVHRPVLMDGACALQGDGCAALGSGFLPDAGGSAGFFSGDASALVGKTDSGSGPDGAVPNPARLTAAGYGVEMAIKNMEYKAIDDDSSADAGAGAGESAAANDASPELKLKQIRDLGLQATQRVVRSDDPLQTMMDLSFDFPAIAAELSAVRVDEATAAAAAENAQKLSGGGSLVMSLNGEPLEMETVNVFSLLDRVADELRLADVFLSLGLEHATVRRLLRMRVAAGGGGGGASGAPDFPRLDVVDPERDPASPRFANDVEKDRAFKSWDPSLSGLLVPDPLGGPPRVRRNLLNFIAVVVLGDDADEENADDASRASWALVDALDRAAEQGVGFRVAHVLLTGDDTDDKNTEDDPDLPPGLGIADALARAHATLARRFGGRFAGTFLREVVSSRPETPAHPFAPPARFGAAAWRDAERAFARAHKRGFRAAEKKRRKKESKEKGGGGASPEPSDEDVDADFRATLADALRVDGESAAASFAAEARASLARRGVTGVSCLVNGLHFTLQDARNMGADLSSLAFHLAQRELDLVARAVYAGELTDAVADADARGAYGWVHRGALRKRSAVMELAASEEAAYVLMKPEEGDEDSEKGAGSRRGGSRVLAYAQRDPSAAAPATAWVVADAGTAAGANLIAAAYAFVEGTGSASPESSAASGDAADLRDDDTDTAALSDDGAADAGARARVAVLHPPDAAPSPRARALARLARDAPSARVAASARAVLSAGASAAPEEGDSEDAALDALLARQGAFAASALGARRVRRAFSAASDAAGVVVLNGRVVEVPGSLALDADDFAALASAELEARGDDVLAAIVAADPDQAAAEADGKRAWKKSRAGTSSSPSTTRAPTPAETSDACATASSLVARRQAVAARTSRGQVVDLSILDTPHASFVQGDARAVVTLEAVLDPLSAEARRAAPVLKALRDALAPRVAVRVILNPRAELEDLPLTSFYRYAAPSFAFPRDTREDSTPKKNENASLRPSASFASLPAAKTLTAHLDVPEQWLVTTAVAAYDLDNIRLEDLPENERFMRAEYRLEALLVTGHCSEVPAPTGADERARRRAPPPSPRGAQLRIGDAGTIVMSNLGYFQLPARPGAHDLRLRPGRTQQVYRIAAPAADLDGVFESVARAVLGAEEDDASSSSAKEEKNAADDDDVSAEVTVSSWNGRVLRLLLARRPGMEHEDVLEEVSHGNEKEGRPGGPGERVLGWWGAVTSRFFGARDGARSAAAVVLDSDAASSSASSDTEDALETIHVFSVASGHLYERFLKIMMLSVRRHTRNPLKFWFIKNWLSPRFKDFLPHIAAEYGFEYELVTYKWPTWLNRQTEKQRIIWAYKLLFLDVLFPLTLDKIIFVDADQVVRADLRELWEMDLRGAPYAYTPFCDNNKEMEGYRFWKSGFWKNHLNGKPYHISALYVVDLARFRRTAAGDQLRVIYEQLSQDPNSLANLDQDLPNYAQHQVPIHSLPQPWLWCESWCGNETKAAAKTIDLCNNPMTKEPKLLGAARIVHEWPSLDKEVRAFTDSVERRIYGEARTETPQERAAREAAEKAAANGDSPRDEL